MPSITYVNTRIHLLATAVYVSLSFFWTFKPDPILTSIERFLFANFFVGTVIASLVLWVGNLGSDNSLKWPQIQQKKQTDNKQYTQETRHAIFINKNFQYIFYLLNLIFNISIQTLILLLWRLLHEMILIHSLSRLCKN